MKEKVTNRKYAEQGDKRQNEIIRVQKKRGYFVMLDKGFLEDDRLSFKAKGILAYLLSKPDGWKVIVKDIVNHGKDGESAVYSGLNELKKYGFYKKEPVRGEKGAFIRWESVVYECPNEGANANAPYPPKTQKKRPAPKNTEKAPIIPPLPNISDMATSEMAMSEMETCERSNININKNQPYQNYISIYQEENETTELTEQPTSQNNDMIDIQLNKEQEQVIIENAQEQVIIEPEKNVIEILSPEQVADKISLAELKEENPDKLQEINMLHRCVCDVLAVDNPPVPYIRIAKQNLSFLTVKDTFKQIEKRHIEYVIDCLYKNSNKSKIDKNIKSYLMTSLFHAPRTISYYFDRSFKQHDNIVNTPQKKSSFDIDDFFNKAVMAARNS